MGFLSEGSLYSRIFGFLGQLIILNLLWIFCCIPVITAGASTTALFYCVLRMHKEGYCFAVKDFFKSFKRNFKQATLIWLLILIFAGVLYVDKSFIPQMSGIMSIVFSYILVAVFIPAIMLLLYIFPTVAAFENKIKNLITNAFYFAVKNIFYTLAMAAITILPMFFTLVDAKLFPIYLFVWLLCGFSLTAYADAWFIWKIFKPYFKEDGEEKEYKDLETDRYVF